MNSFRTENSMKDESEDALLFFKNDLVSEIYATM